MDTSITDVVKLMEQTVAAIGISISQAVAHYDIPVDEDRANQICDEALAVFMTEGDVSHMICSDMGKIGN